MASLEAKFFFPFTMATFLALSCTKIIACNSKPNFFSLCVTFFNVFPPDINKLTDKGSDQSERVFTHRESQSGRSPSSHVYLHTAAIIITFIIYLVSPIFAAPPAGPRLRRSHYLPLHKIKPRRVYTCILYSQSASLSLLYTRKEDEKRVGGQKRSTRGS